MGIAACSAVFLERINEQQHCSAYAALHVQDRRCVSPPTVSDDQVDGFGAQNEIRGLEVDHLIGAHFRHESDVARSAGGNHLRPCTVSKLNDEIANGSGGAVDKNTLHLPRFERSSLLKRIPKDKSSNHSIIVCS
jgi:hypothetical protein